ncbi:EscC/YscC/HrcC family type III secretion system outer membrane ring protein [Sphingomonas spermidinifaciens]|uniref:Type 3 secretion system secretin n=1 Tax=Sphingomonas spermidinifaciens TaxID=1141889 RepID=A0A2A4B567_9SPHN|nr:type III secretion system outer membrane ring subunit SctC [Sphingomonas spermidinifaciens]PCD03207.1 EscC/YscC/HrcC family type III secretion system outer membrane ring protein [Sphingomonas spermidinifaciens]
MSLARTFTLSGTATAVIAALMVVAPQPGVAADPPFRTRPVTLTPRNQDVGAFVREFFSAAGLTVNVDARVTGKINGRFSGAPAQVWNQVSRAFNLVAYYDGSVVTVYSADQVESRTVSVPAGRAPELAAGVADAGLADSTNRVRPTGEATILATGVPRFLDQVQQLAAAAPSRSLPGMGGIGPNTAQIAPAAAPGPSYIEPYELRVFYLRYVRADDTKLVAGGRELTVPGVGTSLSRIMGDGSAVAGSISASYGGRTLRQSAQRLGGRGLNSIAPDANQTPQLTPYDDEYLGLPPSAPVPVVSAREPSPQGGPRIAIDPSLNAVIVRDRPENMPAYEGLVRALDIAPQIVELEATIIDLNIEKLRDLGIDWRIRSQGFNALFGGDILRRSGNPNTDTSRFGAPNEGLSLSGVIGANREFIGRISALERRGAAKIVSRPQIVTLSNIEAVFDRTRTFYVRIAGDRQVDLFNVTAGTVLRVNPHVLIDNGQPRIRMVVGVEDGTLLNQEVDDIPVVERASVNTQAMINEGEGLLLGGLTVNAQFDAESKIPLLGDIPVLGELFKTRNRNRQQTERLFLITPRIIRLDQLQQGGAVAALPAAGAGEVTARLPTGNPLTPPVLKDKKGTP